MVQTRGFQRGFLETQGRRSLAKTGGAKPPGGPSWKTPVGTSEGIRRSLESRRRRRRRRGRRRGPALLLRARVAQRAHGRKGPGCTAARGLSSPVGLKNSSPLSRRGAARGRGAIRASRLARRGARTQLPSDRCSSSERRFFGPPGPLESRFEAQSRGRGLRSRFEGEVRGLGSRPKFLDPPIEAGLRIEVQVSGRFSSF